VTAARALVASDIAPLVRQLGMLGARKPSQTWLRGAQETLRSPGAADLLRRWLELAAYTDVVPPDDTVAFSGGMLFTRGNEELVRAAVIVARVLPAHGWVPVVLGVLARRGSATSGQPGMTAALALKVATSAVDTLAARNTAADRQVLEELLEDLSRRDLVKRVGAALGREAEADTRIESLRREKAATVRRKADPAPRQLRARVDALLRFHLGPELRRLGFRGSGRTWRRFHDDRVDVVALGSHDDELHLSYGVRLDAAHPEGESYPVDRTRVRDYELDVRLGEEWSTSESELDRCARHLAATVVPFLDTFGRYELARAYLEHGAGAPAGALSLNNPGSPDTNRILGMLALAAGDRFTAVDQLQRLVAVTEEWAASATSADDDAHADVVLWRAQLVKAQRLTR